MSFESTRLPSVQESISPQARTQPEKSVDEVLAELLHANTTLQLKQQLPDFTHSEQTVLGVPTHQLRLLQSEKMSSLGQIVAGVAHEINNPASFIYGNLFHLRDALGSLLSLIQLYQEYCPQPSADIQAATEEIDLEFLQEDLPKMLASMEVGANRIRQIVLSLRNFSRLGEAQLKSVDLHEGLESTLSFLKNRLKGNSPDSDIQIISEYGDLPPVECYASQMNQVFLASISRAIEAINDAYKIRHSSLHQEPPYPRWAIEKPSQMGDNCDRQFRGKVRISTHREGDSVLISISDNGLGILEKVRRYLFDPSFTTHPRHQSKTLGLAIAHQIVVEQHGGQFKCIFHAQQGTQFLITLPIYQAPAQSISCTRENCNRCNHLEC
jgi:signal transduction histidine kinase